MPNQIPQQCPQCGGNLIKKRGKWGDFLGCENFSSKGCNFTFNLSQAKETPTESPHKPSSGLDPELNRAFGLVRGDIKKVNKLLELIKKLIERQLGDTMESSPEDEIPIVENDIPPSLQ